MSKFLNNIKKNILVKSKKNRTFANDNDDNLTALATDCGKVIPTLTRESARLFLERARKAEEEAEKRRNDPPSLEGLKKELSFNKFLLGQNIDEVKVRYDKICDLEKKIKELEVNLNGKREEE